MAEVEQWWERKEPHVDLSAVRPVIPIKIKKLSEDAVIPTYAHHDDSGFDLVAVEDVVIPGLETALVATGLVMEIPDGYEVQIRPRSSMAGKRKLFIPNSPGTIDAGYRGEIKILISNFNEEEVTVEKGTAIAQGVLCVVPYAQFKVCDELSPSSRGENGFGSTGEKRC